MGRFKIAHWFDRQRMVPIISIPLGIVLLGIVIVIWIQRIRSAEANTAMMGPPAPIDGGRAYGYLKKICELGPRPAGSEANTRQRKLVSEHFTKLGAKVHEQPFETRHPLTGERVMMANLVGSWHPERLNRIVIGAHYDTRPHPDQEVDPARQNLPFLGANDGASGVALLMELAHHLEKLESQWGVDLVLFDGEELVYGNDPRGQAGEYFLGSREFQRLYARHLDVGRSKMRYSAGLVLDMIGGKNLRIKQEWYSRDLHPELVRSVWGVARQLRAESFLFQVGQAVRDDHLQLIDAGIPTIDIIDFEYPFWHKADDLPEKCSAESLAEVGRVITAWLTQPQRRLRR
jgi:hypothetical protein